MKAHKKLLPVLTLLIHGLASGAATLPVEPSCMVTEDKLEFHLAFEIKYKQPYFISRAAELYQILCDRRTSLCSGIRLDLDKKKISVTSLIRFEGAKLTTDKGSLHIIEWGTYRVFSFDSAKRSVTYREAGDSKLGGKVEGFSESSCSGSK